jgi:putative OPT family oligopeptide transporter
MAGSMISFFVLVPMFGYVGQYVTTAIPPATVAIAGMAPDQIFRLYVRPIGIGGIFAAGLLSIIKMSPVIAQATKQAFGEAARLVKGGAAAREEIRTERSMPMSLNLLGIVAVILAVFLYFRFSVLAGEPRALMIAAVAALMTLVIAFLFASVSAWAIAMISITPISGMTLTTLIVTAVTLSAMGLSGQGGMLQVLLIGGVVCTALSMSGSLVTQYKIAYWLGATPRRIEISNLVGAVAASAATTAVILLMARVYGFAPDAAHLHPLPAPQPNAMAAVLRGVMGEAGTPWFLYGIGAVFAVTSQMCGFSGLAFALGMYLPMELNSPLVLGAAIAWLLEHSSKVAPLAKARHEKGTLIASGFIAGGALIGVLAALLRFIDDTTGTTIVSHLDLTTGGVLGALLAAWGNWLGLLAFLALGTLVYLDGRREKAA